MSVERTSKSLQVGARIEVHSVKYDGSPHRWWRSRVCGILPDGIVLDTPQGTPMFGPKGGWTSQGGRTRLWWERWYNVYEAPENSISLRYYVHIATPPTWSGDKLVYVDLDVDVIMDVNGNVRVEDEDEFEEGIRLYGYDKEIIRRVEHTTQDITAMFGQSNQPWDLSCSES